MVLSLFDGLVNRLNGMEAGKLPKISSLGRIDPLPEVNSSAFSAKIFVYLDNLDQSIPNCSSTSTATSINRVSSMIWIAGTSIFSTTFMISAIFFGEALTRSLFPGISTWTCLEISWSNSFTSAAEAYFSSTTWEVTPTSSFNFLGSATKKEFPTIS